MATIEHPKVHGLAAGGAEHGRKNGAPVGERRLMPHRTRLLGAMDQFLDLALGEIDRAERRVLVECFIVRADRLGTTFGQALCRAAARGVDTRLIYDPMGCRTTPSAYFKDLAARGVVVRRYGRAAGPLARFWPRARNHSRIYVFDDVAYTGGQAWGDEWLPRERGGQGWQDVVCRVQGPLVEDFAELFQRKWLEATGQLPLSDWDTAETYPDLRLISDVPDDVSRLLDAHLAAFAEARQRILVANAYCFPPRRMLVELLRAARRGVDVRVLLPGASDIPLIRRAARAEYPLWMDSGVSVWEYQGPVMHAKYALCDDNWAAVGTFNANAGSLALSIEIAVIARELGLCASVAEQFERDLAHSVRLLPADVARRGLWDRTVDGLAYTVMSAADAILAPG